MIDPKTFNSVAQAGHFACGMLCVFGPAYLFGHSYSYCGAGAITLYALAKEFWWDEKYESTEVRGSSLEDFIFYVLGAAGALLLQWAVLGL